MPYAYGDYILTCGEIPYQSFGLDRKKTVKNGLFSGLTGQNYNSIKNRIISYIPRATPPNIVVNIVTIAIILNGCL